MSINLNISNKNNNSINQNSEMLIYRDWKNYRKETGGYFLISNTIEEYLPYIKDGSLTLYLFYLIHAKNETGNSFYSVETISQILNVSTKTISNWNSNLSDLGLISRQKGKKSSNTFLLPTSNFTKFVTDLKNSELLLAIKDLNYKKEKSIILSQKARNGVYMFYQFEIYYKEHYSNKENISIKRYIYIGQKIDLNIKFNSEPQQELTWGTISNYDNTDIFVYTGHKSIRYDINNTNTDEELILDNITSLIDQIIPNIKYIKQNYQNLNPNINSK